jgi:hypothetical protein
LRTAVRPGRLCADIENVGALLHHFARMGNRHCRIEKLAAVGKRVRRHVEDAHDQRPALREQGGQRIACLDIGKAHAGWLCAYARQQVKAWGASAQ